MRQALRDKWSVVPLGLVLVSLLAAPGWAVTEGQDGLQEAAEDQRAEAERKAAAEEKAKKAAVPLDQQPVPTRFGPNLPTAAPGYQGAEPGGVYSIDVDNQSWTDETGAKVKLPFDVPFVVKGSVDAGTTSVRARFVEFARSPDCLDLFQRTRYKVAWEDDLLENVPVRARQSAIPIEKTEPVTGFISGPQDNRTFQVELLPLRPNRYYCFEFALSGKLSAEQEKAVREQFRVAIDQELREPAYQGTTTFESGIVAPIIDITGLDDYEAFREDLRLLLEELVEPPRALKVEVGSFFDPETPYEDLEDAYKDEVDDVLRQQEDARHAFGNFHAQATNAETNLLLARSARYTVAKATKKGEADRTASLVEILGELTQVPTVSAALTAATQNTGVDPLQLFDASSKTTYTRRQIESLTRGLRTGQEDPWTDVFAIPTKSEMSDRLETLTSLSGAVKAVRAISDDVGFGKLERVGGDPDDPDIPKVENDLAAVEAGLDNAVSWLKILQEFPAERARLIDKMLEALLVEVRKVLRIGGSTVADYNTRAIWYMSADLGAGLSYDTEDFFTYVGWNIYLRPVNKKALLSWPGRPFTLREEFMRRFSFTLGVVQSGFDEETGKIEGVIGNNAALLGAGFRINDSLRLSFGGMVFERVNPSPLISTKELSWSPYLALSVDWNASKTFAKILP